MAQGARVAWRPVRPGSEPGRRRWEWLLGLLAVAVLTAAPVLLSSFRLNLLAKFLTYAIAAIGIDLAWGYTGLLTLGQGLFFGLGAYCMGMLLKLEASGDWLPDFMSWSGLQQLPWFWVPFRHAWFAFPMAVVLPVATAAGLGYLVFRSRIRGPYFAIITQASTLIFATLLVGQQPYTGGTNGITNFSTLLGFPLADRATQVVLYEITVLSLVLCYVAARRLTVSRFGRLMVAVRDSENRLRFTGYDPVLIKTVVFSGAAGLAGLAGALFVPQVGIISPAMLDVVPSIEMVVWVAVGGRGTLTGAVIGTLVVNWAKSLLSESFPSAWLYVQGALFLGVVLLFHEGLVGVWRRLWRRPEASAPMAVSVHAGGPIGSKPV